MTDNIIKRLREAIAAGPTPIDPDLYGDRYFSDDYSRCDLTKEQDAFVRAASPDNIAALLDELDRLRAENEALASDACRYRWIKSRIAGDSWLMRFAASNSGTSKSNYAIPLAVYEARTGDAAIDAARSEK